MPVMYDVHDVFYYAILGASTGNRLGTALWWICRLFQWNIHRTRHLLGPLLPYHYCPTLRRRLFQHVANDPNSRAHFRRQAAAWEDQPMTHHTNATTTTTTATTILVGPKHGLEAAATYGISFHRIRSSCLYGKNSGHPASHTWNWDLPTTKN
jgi:hypothetical protein